VAWNNDVMQDHHIKGTRLTTAEDEAQRVADNQWLVQAINEHGRQQVDPFQFFKIFVILCF
jgi:hypothetical protein